MTYELLGAVLAIAGFVASLFAVWLRVNVKIKEIEISTGIRLNSLEMQFNEHKQKNDEEFKRLYIQIQRNADDNRADHMKLMDGMIEITRSLSALKETLSNVQTIQFYEENHRKAGQP